MDLELTDAVQHVWEQRISLADIDWNGHVNNVRMIAWVQDSWTDLVLPDSGTTPPFAAVRHDVRYFASLPYCSSIEIRSTVTDIRRCSFTGVARITDGETVHAQITTTWVAFDSVSHRARTLTDGERRTVTRYYVPGAGEEPGEASESPLTTRELEVVH